MERLFGKVWILILIGMYLYLWTRVAYDIKINVKWYPPIKVFRHLEPFTKVWIIAHIAIMFLWSLSVWEG